MSDHPPPCDGCDHPPDMVDSTIFVRLQANDMAYRCRQCWNYWMRVELNDKPREYGEFSNPIHIPQGTPMHDSMLNWTWPEVDNRPPPRGGFF